MPSKRSETIIGNDGVGARIANGDEAKRAAWNYVNAEPLQKDRIGRER